jgi:outer membrane biosynthesis protein TonB
MPEDKEQLSPEERLLRVIQGDGRLPESTGLPAELPDESPAETVAADTDTAATLAVEERPDPAETIAEPEPRPAPEPEPEPEPVPEPESEPEAEPDTIAEPEAESPQPEPKLKLAKTEAEPDGSEERPDETAEPAAKGPLVGDAPVTAELAVPGEEAEPAEPEQPEAGQVASRKKRAASGYGIGIANKCLIVAVILLVLFMVVEILANIRNVARGQRLARMEADSGGTDADKDVAGAPSQYVLPPVASILKTISERDIFNPPGVVTNRALTGGNRSTQIFKEQLSLIGLSSSDEGNVKEAIVVDKKENKMHFLEVGDAITVEEQRLKLDEIHADRVVFSVRGTRITVQ